MLFLFLFVTHLSDLKSFTKSILNKVNEGLVSFHFAAGTLYLPIIIIRFTKSDILDDILSKKNLMWGKLKHWDTISLQR